MNKTLTIGAMLICILMQASAASAQTCLSKLTKEDMELLIKDAPPRMIKSLEDPEVKKEQIKGLREMLAMACAAERDGVTGDSMVRAELENIRIEQLAKDYDREINKDKGLSLPFGSIDENRVKEFWKGDREAAFQKFLDAKIAQFKEDNQVDKDRNLSEDEINQARDYFAKTRIYAEEAETKWSGLPLDFRRKTELAIKLHQAQYLARIYATKFLSPKLTVTDEEIRAFQAERPEFDTRAQREKAAKILQRAKAGEDFAKLAKEFSEDPGSKEQGGLYQNVPQGQMVPEFEQAALALEPGQIAPDLVETKYGFHIIKLEKKGSISNPGGEAKQVYDVRHILIMTTIKDPDKPLEPPKSARDFVYDKLLEKKERLVIEKVVADNPVEIAENFEIPKISDEQLQQQMMQQISQAEIKNEALPAKIKGYLDRIYKGWKLSPSEEGCGMDVNNGVVKGNFNADRKFDYAVKFTRGRRGYLIAFIALTRGYRPFVLHRYAAGEAENSSLSIWKKGVPFPYSDYKSIVPKYDALADFACESDVGGIHLYRNGKFVAY